MTSLQGTTVLVTGAAGGLGKVIAATYLEAGANVAICDINEARLSATKEEFEPTGRFAAFKTDITDEAAVTSLVSDVVSKFGRLDILVNNAGLMDVFDPVGELKKETWDKLLNVNLTGSFLCMKAAVNTFQKQEPRGGTIIQIGSNASYMGFCAGTAYTVSKHGVAALVKSTAGFYGDEGIYAIGLMLGGMIDTNIAESVGGLGGFNQAGYGKTAADSPFKPESAVQLKDVAKYCIFLADRSIAATANGSCVPFNKNWPKA
ncbi:hypothetical protein BKA67DRAFT_522668 [Truncatella angustata]|jgi:NAD(P)-dependent dehydrogenase (short-subunit alcohol dehydrogenase family)|uniref:Uncharacterized protein n=1 Tax=Truncatella angustata TaxID=152316 RepID=A0A9P8UF04_9PEZI|nr:uncharacterized protein BKA67DRAFT_522668 [Truncatella angustata]KAH6648751.1 hypothetical protein BKA67DRAFT_522668 [Truncatella angustata]KAH8201169.1 hypothetical protein TruAng_004637 [Truncatella angustata]